MSITTNKTPKPCWKAIELLTLVFLAAILRLWHINKADIGNDECFTLFYAQFHLQDIISILLRGDNPPLWEILVHGWIIPMGTTALSIRVLSTIFSILTVIPLYLIGEKFIRRYAGVLVSLLYAMSTLSIFLAHDGRVYSLIGFLSGWSLYLFLSLIHTPEKITLTGLTIVNIFIMYGHYLAIWLILMEFLIVLCIPAVRRKIGKLYIYHISALTIAYLPIIPALYLRFLDSGLHGTWVSKNTSIENLYSMLCSFSNDAVPAVFSLVLIAAFFIKRIIHIIKKEYKIDDLTYITAIWIFPLLISFGLSFIVGFFLNRYFYFLLPIYLTAVTAYIFYLFQDKKVLTLIVSLFFVLLWAGSVQIDSTKLRYGGWKGDCQAAVIKMKSLKEQYDAAVIIAPEWMDKQLVYYLDDKHDIFKTQGRIPDEPSFEYFLQSHNFYFHYNFKQESLQEHPYIICFYLNWFDISEIENLMKNSGFQEIECDKFQQIEVKLFHSEMIK